MSLAPSSFVTRNGKPSTRSTESVLVIGGDMTGIEVASRLIDEGFSVVLLDKSHTGHVPNRVRLISDADLDEVRGFVGAFEVFFRTGRQRFQETFGFIVAAAPERRAPKFAVHGLTQSERVISLSDLEVMLGRGEMPAGISGGSGHVAFLNGLDGHADPSDFARILGCLERISGNGAVRSYVFAKDMKVAASGLERRYRQSRERGTLYFKFDDDLPRFEEAPEGTAIVFQDPVLPKELELIPDLIVVDELKSADNSLRPLLDALPASAYTGPYLQPESTRFMGVETPKVGLIAVGANRGNFSTELMPADIEAVVVKLKQLSTEPLEVKSLAVPVIDPEKCTMCLTCVRLCPHGAITFNIRAEADPVTCVGCGICSVECPMEAITLTPGEAGVNGEGMSLRETLDKAGSLKRIVAFLCRRSAAGAMDAARDKARANLTPVVVPCAGGIDISHIIAAFEKGAKGVLTMGCFPGNCASVYGTVLAAQRAKRAKILLHQSGIDPRRVMFRSIASNAPSDFEAAVEELEGWISALDFKE